MRNNNQLQSINLNAHISTLDVKIQCKIAYQLRMCGFTAEDIQLVLSGRLRDLEDNIDIVEVFA